MIIKEEAKRKRQAIVEQRMTKPDLHYTRKPSESVENYADNIVCNRKKVGLFVHDCGWISAA